MDGQVGKTGKARLTLNTDRQTAVLMVLLLLLSAGGVFVNGRYLLIGTLPPVQPSAAAFNRIGTVILIVFLVIALKAVKQHKVVRALFVFMIVSRLPIVASWLPGFPASGLRLVSLYSTFLTLLSCLFLVVFVVDWFKSKFVHV